jgi:two-component system, chemotaxis family, sensor histidine kinase and response regulator WspE
MTTPDLSDLSLIGLFRLEVETQVSELNEQLLKLEKSGWGDASNKRLYDRQSLDSLMRAAHSIKGAARIVQVEPAVKVAHALEDCFIAAQQGILTLSAHHVDVLLSGADLLSRLGSLEESTLANQLAAHEADANAVVLAIEALVSAAERASNESNTVSTSISPHPVEVSFPRLEADLSVGLSSTGLSSTGLSSIGLSSIGLPTDSSTELLPDQPTEESARMIRMSVENLNRLMGIAGESLVEANWLQPFAQSLLQLKRQQQAIIAQLEKQQQNSSLAETVQDMQRCHSLLNDQLSDFDLFSRRFGHLCDRLYREVVASHMCSFGEGSRGYERLVRDLSRRLGKQVSLEITGLSTQVDRDILTKLDTPITHLLTNAVVHGIERPEVRLAQGKPAEGTIRLWAAHRSGMLTITVEDDGAGIEYVQLRQKIVEKGLTTAEIADQLSDFELSEFLFLPGFSTVSQVDEIAGRGYGLDLVRTMAQSVRGSLRAISPAVEDAATGIASGTQFQFQLPLTLSVVRSLLFEVANELYALSLSNIERVIKLPYDQICTSENRPYFSLIDREVNDETERRSSVSPSHRSNHRPNQRRGENISLILAHEVLALTNSAGTSAGTSSSAQTLSVIVIGEVGNRYGLCVDKLLEEQDLVVRPLDSRLGKIPNISAAALSEKGTPILMLDVADVLRSAEKVAAKSASSASWAKEPVAIASFSDALSLNVSSSNVSSLNTPLNIQSPKPADSKKNSAVSSGPKHVLIVDDSMTVRAMEKKLLQNRGYKVDVAIDGAEGWNAVRMTAYDLVITDVDMPRMSGIELIAKMRAHQSTQKLPVIVVSYKDRAEDQLAGLHAGANYYLTKSSFHDDGLINAVVDLIGTSGHD